MPIFYITSSTIINKIPNGVQKRAIMITSLAAYACFNFLNGPSKLLHLPDKLWLIGISQVAQGFFCPLILVPSLPEMIEQVVDEFPGQESDVNDNCAALLRMFIGMGQLSAPIFSSVVMHNIGFRNCCDTVSFILLSYAAIYFIFGDGWGAFRASQWKHIQPNAAHQRQDDVVKRQIQENARESEEKPSKII